MAHMAVVTKGQAAAKVARPLLSTSSAEARTRVLNLYRAWMREVNTIVVDLKAFLSCLISQQDNQYGRPFISIRYIHSFIHPIVKKNNPIFWYGGGVYC